VKIVFLDAATLGNDIDFSIFYDLGEVVLHELTGKEETAEKISDADVVVTNKVVIGEDELKNAENLKLIVVAATGYNNIDIESAKRRGIAVSNVRGYSTESVVQHTFAMLFYLLHHLRSYDDFVKSGKYSEWKMFTNLEYPFHELREMRWGIIGLGNIGRKVAEKASVFVKEVVYYSTSGVIRDEPVKRVELDTLLGESDIVSIHAPLNERTRNLIDYPELKKMKRSAILLNLGRGGIVNEAALARAIDEGIICCAGTDVLEREPPPPSSPLLKIKHRDRILITPHIAWASVEARERLVNEIYDIIIKFQRGEFKNRVA